MTNHLIDQDTIAACATAQGRGGVAVVRVSGPLVLSIMPHILKTELTPRVASHAAFYGKDDQIIDEGIAIYFQNPHSFTGEDVLELQGHGSPVVVDMILERLLQLGVRLARPGEFSERAFLNGKMDLAQAEAVADLIEVSSEKAARLAMRSLQGDFSKAIHRISEEIVYLRMYVEAAIDFTDEEIDFLSDKKVQSQLSSIQTQLKTILMQSTQGSILREGIHAVIAGKPNVGKSSLLNALSGKELAIVTDIPGTTRDVLRDHISIDGIPLHLIDTAGLRESHDLVELEGIRRAEKEIEKADILIYVQTDESEALPVYFERKKHKLVVHNKIDLSHQSPCVQEKEGVTHIYLSAKTKEGLTLLKEQIKLAAGMSQPVEGLYLARRRHLDALNRAQEFIEFAIKQLSLYQNGELAAEDLRLAHQALCEVTGEFTTDDLLGHIFSHFCVGK